MTDMFEKEGAKKNLRGVFDDIDLSQWENPAVGAEKEKVEVEVEKVIATPLIPAAPKVKLSDIARLILNADSNAPAGNAEGLNASRQVLADRLGCTVADIKEVADSYGVDAWTALVSEERVKRSLSIAAERDISWDRLESVVLRKLLNLVENDRVQTVSELAALSKLANQATRSPDRKRVGGGADQPGVGLQVNQQFNNYLPGSPEHGVLPSGHLGRMTLSLTHRIHKQIEGDVVKGARDLDSLEMLSLKDIQEAEKAYGT
jgi:hypothetical protein